MAESVFFAGIACVAAALVGGGLKAFGMEIPALNSIIRQVALAGFGIALMVVGKPQARVPEPVVGPSAAPSSMVPEVTLFSCGNFETIRVDRNSGLIFDGQIPIFIAEAVHGFYRYDASEKVLVRFHLDTINNDLARQGVNLDEESYTRMTVNVMNQIANEFPHNSVVRGSVKYGRDYVSKMDQIFKNLIVQPGLNPSYTFSTSCFARPGK